MKKRFPVPLATMLVIGLAVSGCGDPPNSNGDAAENRSVDLIESTPAATGEIEELDWALFEEPNSFDPSRANGGDSDAVIANVCEGLFRTEPDLSVKPWLAESVDQPDDHTFVLTIRSGVKFHTGEELSAEDVVWNLERNASPDSGEADEFANVESIDQTGDRQVTLTLAENDPQLEYRLAGGAGIIVDPQAVEDQGQDYGTAGSDDGCTGPFSIGEWDAGSKITIERFEDYWDSKGRSLSKQVNFTWGNEATVSNNVRAGSVDGVYLPEPTLVPTLEDVESMSIFHGKSTGAEKLIPTDRGNATDPRIRKALSLAIDRQGIVTAGLQGIGEPWKSPVGRGAWGYSQDMFQDAYDRIDNVPTAPTDETIERARQLVDQAGAPAESIVVASNGTQLRDVIAAALASAGEQIGVDVEIRTFSDAEYGNLFSSPEARAEVDFVSDDWYLSKPEALGLFDNLLPGESSNYLNYDNDEYADLYRKAASTYNEEDRADDVIALQKIALEDMLWIPLASAPTTLVLSDELTGAPVSFIYRTYPWAARIGQAS